MRIVAIIFLILLGFLPKLGAGQPNYWALQTGIFIPRDA